MKDRGRLQEGLDKQWVGIPAEGQKQDKRVCLPRYLTGTSTVTVTIKEAVRAFQHVSEPVIEYVLHIQYIYRRVLDLPYYCAVQTAGNEDWDSACVS